METNYGAVEDAFSRKEIIQKYLKQGTVSYLKAGYLLLEAQKNNDYKKLGYSRQEEYWQYELNLKPRTAYNYIKVVETFPELQELQFYPQLTRLIEISPIACKMQKEEKIEWLHKAETLPPLGWQDEIKKIKGKIATDECNHDCEHEIWERCGKCGKFMKP